MGFIRICCLFAIAFLFFSHNALATGDCDFNGTVTIAEVQSAINMFLGLKPPAPCVDEDLSGSVNIAEVQKTINTFLGLLPAGPTFSISGQVSSDGSGLSDVTMALTRAGSISVTTDTSGNYTFSGLTNGSYTITPRKTGFDFSPASSPQTVNDANISAVNFTATSTQSARIVACPPSGTTNVTIQNFAFTPSLVTVNANDIVKWTNNDASTHTVTSGSTPPIGDGTFSSGNLGGGTDVCVQFPTAGSYAYFCSIHNFMTGSVTVQ